MTGLQIGKAIAALLAAHDGIVEAVGSKVFPIVSKEGTTYPFAVYRRNGIEVQYTKDGKNVNRIVFAGTEITTGDDENTDTKEA